MKFEIPILATMFAPPTRSDISSALLSRRNDLRTTAKSMAAKYFGTSDPQVRFMCVRRVDSFAPTALFYAEPWSLK